MATGAANSEAARDSRALLDVAKSTTHDLYALLNLPAAPDVAAAAATATDPPARTHPSILAALPAAQIASAYRRAAAAAHPDKPRNRGRVVAATEDFHAIKEAWAVLGDEAARAAYDAKRAAAWEREEKEGLLKGRRREMVEALRRGEAGGEKRKRGGEAGNGEVGEVEKAARTSARRMAELEERRRAEKKARRAEEEGVAEGHKGDEGELRKNRFAFNAHAAGARRKDEGGEAVSAAAASPAAGSELSLEERTMLRLKEAQRKREERAKQQTMLEASTGIASSAASS